MLEFKKLRVKAISSLHFKLQKCSSHFCCFSMAHKPRDCLVSFKIQNERGIRNERICPQKPQQPYALCTRVDPVVEFHEKKLHTSKLSAFLSSDYTSDERFFSGNSTTYSTLLCTRVDSVVEFLESFFTQSLSFRIPVKGNQINF